MSNTLTVLLWLIMAIAVASGILSVVMIQKQKDKEYDKGTNATTVKHPIVANPIIMAYIAFPLAVVIGAAILMYYIR